MKGPGSEEHEPGYLGETEVAGRSGGSRLPTSSLLALRCDASRYCMYESGISHAVMATTRGSRAISKLPCSHASQAIRKNHAVLPQPPSPIAPIAQIINDTRVPADSRLRRSLHRLLTYASPRVPSSPLAGQLLLRCGPVLLSNRRSPLGGRVSTTSLRALPARVRS